MPILLGSPPLLALPPPAPASRQQLRAGLGLAISFDIQEFGDRYDVLILREELQGVDGGPAEDATVFG